MKNVLVVDDDEKICWAFEQFLEGEGYSVGIANSAEEGLRRIAADNPDVVLLDVNLPGMSGLEALGEIKANHPWVIVIIITAYDDVETTIEAMRLQAFDFVPKPIDLDIVKGVLERAFRTQSVRSTLSVETMDESPAAQIGGHRLVGKSSQMREIYKLIGVMASNTVTVLIEGETGTGKDLVARAIHAGSERKEQPFIPVDCGALPDELLESELFGYEAGAFTGAKKEGKPGRFELADGGTLFLDEVGNMTPALQVKLLRALQTQEIERLGGTRTLKVDVRVIAATNQELGEMVKRGQFREDLYYRFRRIALHLPPLRERQEDISLLVTHFLQLIQEEFGKPIRGISEEGMKLLQDYAWPGNVRELENCLRSAAALSRADVILPDDLPSEIRMGSGISPTDGSQLEISLKSILQDTTREAIAQGKQGLYEDVVAALDNALIELVLDEFSGNHSKTAELLGMSRTTLLKKIKQSRRTDVE
ncbi:sigma-54-dependent Fis family transcriptional regulator [Candidatus Poribacteria bacterium]|nr:sigma-54-dependent Fis family transcriptional regulator [Candidatus Poribacteria bacterium]MYK93893.1 sigma-54-dependent Fis family transcriptional regulator [Candidatus Poribacteria bacterium]